MELNLKNKVVFVTGGSSGLGEQIIEAFLRESARIVNYDLLPPSDAISASEDYLYCWGDITEQAQIESAFDVAEEKFGSIDILVNNAGTWPTYKILDMTPEQWEKTIKINLKGPFLLSTHFAQRCVEKCKPGVVINIVSPVAYQGSGNGHSAYASAKAALISFNRSMTLELAKNGIRTVAVAPGVMLTKMTQQTLEQKKDNYLKRIPIGRFVEPQEVANVVVFAASEKASAITGTTLDATGGQLGL